MAQEFNLGGMKVNKTTAYISLAAAGGIIAYAWWQHQVNNAAPTSDTGTATDAATEQIDPLTGLPYGDEYGYGSDYSGIGYQGFGFFDPVTGATIGAYGQTVTQVSNNAQWTQSAVAYLVQQGYEGVAVTAALGKVLAGSAVTDDEIHIWQAAIAAEGNPPQSYPPIVHVPGTTPTTPATTTPKAPTGLKAVSISKTQIILDWNPLGTAGVTPGFVGYQVYMNGARQATLSYSGKWTKSHLKPNTSYHFTVYGVYHSGTHDTLGPGTSITVRTKK